MRRLNNELIRNFEEYLINEEKSKLTLEKYIRDVKAFCVWLEGREVDKKVVVEYKQNLIERYAPASVNSILSSLNSFFVYNEWHELRVKALKIQRQMFANKDKELTKEEYERLLKAAKRKNNERLNLLLQTICSTGIRVSELRYICVESLKNKKATINCKGKLRIVILPDQLCKMLKAYAIKQKIISGPIFVTKTGRPLDRANIWKMMRSLCESANVAKEKVFPHNLRHLFARTFYSIEKDVIRLADVLGHTSVNTTRIYTMETGEIHRKLIQKLGLLIS